MPSADRAEGGVVSGELVIESTIAPDRVAAVMAPRDDTILEREIEPGRFGIEEGPYDEYERVVTVEPVADGLVRVVQRIRYRGAPAVLRRPLERLLRADLERLHTGADDWPWWSPPERITARAARILSILCSLAFIAGYAGAVTTQTMTFAAEEFGVSDAAQGNALALIRVGVIASLALLFLADRRGRRRVLLGSVAVAGVATVLGALAPDFLSFAGSQTITRGAVSTAAVLLAVIAVEEVGPRSRAYAVSLLATSGGIGLMLALVLLPLADLAPWSWRLLFVAPIAFVGLFGRARRVLPESRRFEAAAATTADDELRAQPEARKVLRRRLGSASGPSVTRLNGAGP